MKGLTSPGVRPISHGVMLTCCFRSGVSAWAAATASTTGRGGGLSGLAPPPWPTRARLGIEPLLTEGWARMRCLECGSEAVTERSERTAQGYRRFRCCACGKQFNERSDTLLNRAQYPSDVIALVVLWRLRYKLSLRDLPEMFAVRGIVFSHEAVREWEMKLAPALAARGCPRCRPVAHRRAALPSSRAVLARPRVPRTPPAAAALGDGRRAWRA